MGALQMGTLAAIGRIPTLAFALIAGVYVDRIGSRALMGASEALRATTMLAIVLSTIVALNLLPAYYVMAFFLAFAALFYDLAQQAYIGESFSKERLVAANGTIRTALSAGIALGPISAGALRPHCGYPVIFGIALTLSICSLFLVWCFPSVPVVGEGRAPRKRAFHAAVQGLRIIWDNRKLRILAILAAFSNLAYSMVIGLFVLYAVRNLALGSAAVGTALSISGLGFLAGSVLSSVFAMRFGIARATTLGFGLDAVGWGCVALAGTFAHAAFWCITVGNFLATCATAVLSVCFSAMRQGYSPAHSIGVVSGGMRMLAWWLMPVGALVGGWLANARGVVTVLVVATVINFLLALWSASHPRFIAS